MTEEELNEIKQHYIGLGDEDANIISQLVSEVERLKRKIEIYQNNNRIMTYLIDNKEVMWQYIDGSMSYLDVLKLALAESGEK